MMSELNNEHNPDVIQRRPDPWEPNVVWPSAVQPSQSNGSVMLTVLQPCFCYYCMFTSAPAVTSLMPADHINVSTMAACSACSNATPHLHLPIQSNYYQGVSTMAACSVCSNATPHLHPPIQSNYYQGDRWQGVGWANTGRSRGLRARQQAIPFQGQGMRGRGRGGIARHHQRRPVTREELDEELDQYMGINRLGHGRTISLNNQTQPN